MGEKFHYASHKERDGTGLHFEKKHLQAWVPVDGTVVTGDWACVPKKKSGGNKGAKEYYYFLPKQSRYIVCRLCWHAHTWVLTGSKESATWSFLCVQQDLGNSDSQAALYIHTGMYTYIRTLRQTSQTSNQPARITCTRSWQPDTEVDMCPLLALRAIIWDALFLFPHWAHRFINIEWLNE